MHYEDLSESNVTLQSSYLTLVAVGTCQMPISSDPRCQITNHDGNQKDQCASHSCGQNREGQNNDLKTLMKFLILC